MVILHDPRCAEYGSAMRPEQPARVTRAAAHLRRAHPDWIWREPSAAVTDELLQLAHTAATSNASGRPATSMPIFFFPGIGDHARRSVAAALEAAQHALATRAGEPVFSLMRPPGHHATAAQAMGFCYLNQIAIAALVARQRLGAKRVAVWDFDAHHGNGTEAILQDRDGLFFASVHQYPGYPGTGTQDHGPHIRNWPVAAFPRRASAGAARGADAVGHLPRPIVSAGFAYAHDPITR